MSLGDGYDVRHEYDTVGRLSTVAWNVHGTEDAATYVYVPGTDLLESMTTASGEQRSYQYEPTRRLQTQVRNKFGNHVVSQYDYIYDVIGPHVSVQTSGAAFAQAAFSKWAYDDRNQLTKSDRFLGASLNDTSRPVEVGGQGLSVRSNWKSNAVS